MKIAITGATGLIGSEISNWAEDAGHEVIRLVRTPKRDNDIAWNSEQALEPKGALAQLDCIVNLAGAPIAEDRWSNEVKKRIYRSRVHGTQQIVKLIAQLPQKPALIQASAIGYYGSRGDSKMTEEDTPGDDFLAKVCADWEREAHTAQTIGATVSVMRIGVVLSHKGGALKKMLPAFRWAVGGRLGSGSQYMSWVSLEDVVRAFAHRIEHPKNGTYNLTAPNPVTNAEFTKTLSSVLKRPAVLPVPATVLKLLLGEMAEALLLSSTRVYPNALLDEQFQFSYPELPQALEAILAEDAR